MVTLTGTSTVGNYTVNLPTSMNEISDDYIKSITNHIKIAANYTLVGLIYKERLSTLYLSSKKNSKKTDISVVPIYIKSGTTNSELIESLNLKDTLIISPSDIMMGHHVSAPNNILTIPYIMNVMEGDSDIYSKLLPLKDYCYFVEFKLIPNCNIHGAYIEKDMIKPAHNFVSIVRTSEG